MDEFHPKAESEEQIAQNEPDGQGQRLADFDEVVSRRTFLSALAATILATNVEAAQAAPKAVQGIPYRPLGSTGANVSIVGLGGWHIGIQQTARESENIIRSAIDSGVNFLDNCWDYNGGASEERMGRALRNGYRDKAFLMTKIDGRDSKTAAKQIDESLSRLKTDRIDLVQFHEIIRASDAVNIFAKGGAIEAAITAKKQGKIRFIGFTGHKSPAIHLKMLQAADAHGFRFDAVQMPLNVMDCHYDSFEKLVLPVLVKKRMAVLGMKPMGAGIILKSGVVAAIECLHYAMDLPTSVVITGCDSMVILQQALQAARSFKGLSTGDRVALLKRTRNLAGDGSFERYKTTETFDGTTQHPEWMG